MAIGPLAGCGADMPGGPLFSLLVGDGHFAEETVDGDMISTTTRAGGPFGRITELTLTDGVRLSVDGALRSPSETATFGIGAIMPGEMLTVEVLSRTQGFDPAVAVFNADQSCLHLNDDRHYYNRQYNPYLQFVIGQASSQCYVVVTPSPRSDTTGDYTLKVTRRSDRPLESPRPQVIYLSFDGQNGVRIGRRTPVDVPPFNGAMIDASLATETDALIEMIVDRIRSDYAPFNVTVLSSHEQDPPADEHTVIYFGAYNASLLGIADSVDSFNANRVQDAIVFVDTFTVFMSQDPTIEEMAHALANVGSHEIGHLVGLHHTADPTGIMDTTATLRKMLLPQSFNRSLLNHLTFPVGYQDSVLTLGRNVGLARGAKSLRPHLQIEPDPWYEGGPIRPARTLMPFGTGCGCSDSARSAAL